MASLRKEQCEAAEVVAVTKLDAEAVMAWAAMQRLVVKLHMI